MYFFRTFKESTAPYKVHNMGLRYIKEGGIHFMYRTSTLCPAQEKNAGDLEIGHEYTC